MKKVIIILLALTLTGCGKQTEYVEVERETEIISDESGVIEEIVADESMPVIVNNDIKDSKSNNTVLKVEVPTKLDLAVPFVSQAPLRNWAMPYQEACEEASMLSVAKYFKGGDIDNLSINTELLKLINWEEENGYKIDVDAAETVQILQNYFGLKSQLTEIVTVDIIKYELAQGHLIIIPTAGRMLKNPYFTGAGPIYHMLVIRGYDSNDFITNDVGTNTKGEKFKYKYQTIIDSIHDWNHSLAEEGMTDEEMAMGRKVMIVVYGTVNN